MNLSQDAHGIRITAGKPLPISSVDSRQKLKGDTPQLDIDVSGDSIDIGLPGGQLDLRFAHTKEWFKIELNHQFDAIYGLGEKNGGMDKIGKKWVFWNFDDANFEATDDPLYKSYPLMVARSGNHWISIIIDYPGYQQWDLRDQYTANFHIHDHDFVLDMIVANSLPELLAKQLQVLGTMELPPLWSLGYHQCRWSYFPADRVREIADGFRSRKIPIDALYLDIDYMEGFRCFTVAEKFGDLGKLIKDLHRQNIYVVTMIDPGIKRDSNYFVYQQGVDNDFFIKRKGKIYHAPVWPGKSAFPDFMHSEVRDWWGQLYADFVELGVDGCWNDMNEPSIFTLYRTMVSDAVHTLDDGQEVDHGDVHNLFGQKMVQGSYTGLKHLQKGKRVFLLSRSGYLGSQKYGWIWTGDNKSDWDHLRQSIPKLLNSGLSGHFANGPDIGGFREHTTGELYARWIQLGVFYPLMRTHTVKFVESQEPWSFGPEVEKIAKEMIELRYKILPYIYTYFEEACRTGIPLMRPMFLEFPEDQTCYSPEIVDTQFMFGPDLLVAPVLYPNQRSVKVYLPEGTWYDFFDRGTNLQGGKFYDIKVELNHIPVFVRENRLIPAVKRVGENAAISMASGIEFLKFGKKAEGLVYLDDFETYQFQEGKFGLYRVNSNLEWELIDGSGGFDTKNTQ
jgi:alpha-glucosidase